MGRRPINITGHVTRHASTLPPIRLVADRIAPYSQGDANARPAPSEGQNHEGRGGFGGLIGGRANHTYL